MPSNYRILGDYIQPCNEKNLDNEIPDDMLRGISNQKHFQKAKTNTIGVDLSKYRIVRKGQFAFNRATTRNGDKISIALRQGADCIVSPSYRVFKSKDENILNSEFLMMWFRRPEFDRYARYKSHGSAHEFFDYDEMCEVELPIPSIEKQREIVKEYNTVTNRIKLNEQLNQKLEETAQALYKYWFVDFEFLNEKGKPYKSSGGEMVYNEELDKEIPVGWEVKSLSSMVDSNSTITYGVVQPGSEDPNGVKFIRSGDIENGQIQINRLRTITSSVSQQFKRTILSGGEIVISIVGKPGQVAVVPLSLNGGNIARQVALIKISIQHIATYIKNYLNSGFGKKALRDITIGSVQEVINLSDLRSLKVLMPVDNLLLNYFRLESKFQLGMDLAYTENQPLQELQNLLLAKMTKVEVEKELTN